MSIDKRFPKYLGKLVIKSGVTEVEAMAGMARHRKLAEIRVAEVDAIAGADARVKTVRRNGPAGASLHQPGGAGRDPEDHSGE